MNCKFCNELCFKIDLDQYTSSQEVWECSNHGNCVVQYYFLVSYHKKDDCDGPNCCPKIVPEFDRIYCIHKSNMYYVNLFHNPKRLRLDKYIDHNKYNQPVLQLNFHPDVTPENIEAKVATWLTFS